MEGLVYLIIIIFAFFLLIILPLWLSYKIYKKLSKKQLNWKYRLIAFIPIVVSSFLIYFSFYPTDSHYKEIYEQVTDEEFPEDARFISKYSADPVFLEGWTLFMIEISPAQYHLLEQKLISKGYEVDKDSKEFMKSKYKGSDFFKIKQKQSVEKVLFKMPATYVYYGVAFLDDGKTIIIKKII